MDEQSRKQLVETLSGRAENLYRTRQHLCADAILLAFNEVLDGGLTEQQAVGLTAGMSMGQGESGCLCGAVAGGTLALGLFLAGEGGAYRNSALVRAGVRRLHERFKAVNGSTCCRVLTKKVNHDSALHFEQCAQFTGDAARMAGSILFELRPALADRADRDRAETRDSLGRGVLRRLFNRLFR
jgi:C_GCAxxG_C_C family probable redox protein